MALMKMGRRGDPPTKKKGEDPKKKAADPKNVQEVTVTAKKPVAKSTWEDVDRQAENKKAWDKYDSDMKFYQSGPPANSYIDGSGSWQKIDSGQKISKGGKDVSGRDVSFESSNDTYSASRMNKEANEIMKKDKYVSIDDPSLDQTTRSLLKEVTYGDNSSNLYGKRKGQYVPAGTKLKNRTDVWGEDFNHKEWVDAANSGKFDEYAKKKGYGGRSFKSNIGFVDTYDEPEAPKEDLRNMKINNNDLEMPKLPTKKAGPIPTKGGSIIERKATEKAEPENWSIAKPSKFHGTSISRSAPSLNRRKAVKGEDNVKFGGGANVVVSGVNRGYFGIKKLGYAAVANPLQKVRFNKEVRQGKAYFGSNEGSTSGDLATKRSDLKSDKADYKTSIKEVRKGKPIESLTKSERIRGYRAEIGTINKDLRTTNKASRYLKDLGQPSANTKITEYKTSAGDVKTINTGKIQYATPGRFEGYSDSPQNKRVDKLANLRINPANRNTIELQLKTNKKSSNKLKN